MKSPKSPKSQTPTPSITASSSNTPVPSSSNVKISASHSSSAVTISAAPSSFDVASGIPEEELPKASVLTGRFFLSVEPKAPTLRAAAVAAVKELILVALSTSFEGVEVAKGRILGVTCPPDTSSDSGLDCFVLDNTFTLFAATVPPFDGGEEMTDDGGLSGLQVSDTASVSPSNKIILQSALDAVKTTVEAYDYAGGDIAAVSYLGTHFGAPPLDGSVIPPERTSVISVLAVDDTENVSKIGGALIGLLSVAFPLAFVGALMRRRRILNGDHELMDEDENFEEDGPTWESEEYEEEEEESSYAVEELTEKSYGPFAVAVGKGGLGEEGFEAEAMLS